MAWQQDQNYVGGYSSYGNYNDGQYGGDSASYDLFDDTGNAAAQNANSESGFGSSSSTNTMNSNAGYYDPNSYGSSADQLSSYRPPSQTGQAYQRG